MDVTSLVNGNGLVSLAIRRSNTAAIAFNTREAATNRPQLVIESVAVVDTTAPSISMSSPVSGATVVGSSVTVSASASDNVGVAGVQFRLDGADLGAEDTSAPYTIAWDTTGVANGLHTLSAVARDASNNSATASDVAVTVSNIAVSVSEPVSGSTASGAAVAVSASASEQCGGRAVQAGWGRSRCGGHERSLHDHLGQQDRRERLPHAECGGAQCGRQHRYHLQVTVTVSNVSVAMTAPTSGTTVFGSAVAVSASVSENVVGVQFRLDGDPLGSEVTTAPYSIAWDSTTASNGWHTLTAVARDAAGNTATSSDVAVTVSNPSTTTILPVADTEVNASTPSTNYGRASALGLDGSPVRVGYLLFNVSVPPGEIVTRATLRLFTASSSSADGVFVNQVTNTNWSETTTTYSNAPGIGSQVAASGSFPANDYVSMDVTPAVTGTGLVSSGGDPHQ